MTSEPSIKLSVYRGPAVTMCWCLRVYWTVLHNLFTRFVTTFADSVYNSDLCARLMCCSHSTCCFCCGHCLFYKHTQREARKSNDNDEEQSELTLADIEEGLAKANSPFQHHDYVIVGKYVRKWEILWLSRYLELIDSCRSKCFPLNTLSLLLLISGSIHTY